MTDAKIVGLRGIAPDLTPGETDPEMIKFLEDLLRRAKEGKMMGLCGSFMQDNGEPAKYSSTFVFCETFSHNAMLGLLEITKTRLAAKILDDDQ